MARALHQAKSLGDVIPTEQSIGQWNQGAFGEQSQDFAQQTPRQLLVVPDQLIDVDAEVSEVPSQRPKPEMRVGVEITLAELDEASEPRNAIHGSDHRLARQRIEHDVHPGTVGECRDLVDESQGSRVAHEIGAEIAQQRPLFVAAGGGDDACADMSSDLHRREADGACSAMY